MDDKPISVRWLIAGVGAGTIGSVAGVIGSLYAAALFRGDPAAAVLGSVAGTIINAVGIAAALIIAGAF